MLYAVQSIIMLMWVLFLVRKYKYSWHGVLCVYFLAIMVIDISEISFSTLFTLYDFHPRLLADYTKENELALIFCDGLILPLTAVVFCHFASRTKKHWLLAIVFTAIHFTLEKIYLALGLLHYYHWNIWISTSIYFLGFRIAAHFARRLLLYDFAIPYSLRIATATYSVNAWIGAIIGGAMLGLYQWRPYIFAKEGADERFCDLGMGVLTGILLGLIVPSLSAKGRIWVYMLFAFIASAFTLFAYWQGWFLYHRWSHFLTVMRWLVPFTAISFYDRWESKKRLGFRQSEV